MSQRPDDQNPLDPFGMMRAMRDANMEAWSKAMQQFVNSDQYSQATSAMLDAYLTSSAPFRQLIERSMTEALTQLNMPTRGDVTGIAERLTNIEMRLDDLEAHLDTLRRAGQAAGASSSPSAAADVSSAESTGDTGQAPRSGRASRTKGEQ